MRSSGGREATNKPIAKRDKLYSCQPQKNVSRQCGALLDFTVEGSEAVQ
jgi:hypothetical protein